MTAARPAALMARARRSRSAGLRTDTAATTAVSTPNVNQRNLVNMARSFCDSPVTLPAVAAAQRLVPLRQSLGDVCFVSLGGGPVDRVDRQALG